MSLLNCPECGHKVSDVAIVCPNCGYLMKSKKKKSFINKKLAASLIVILFVFLVAVFLSNWVIKNFKNAQNINERIETLDTQYTFIQSDLDGILYDFSSLPVFAQKRVYKYQDFMDLYNGGTVDEKRALSACERIWKQYDMPQSFNVIEAKVKLNDHPYGFIDKCIVRLSFSIGSSYDNGVHTIYFGVSPDNYMVYAEDSFKFEQGNDVDSFLKDAFNEINQPEVIINGDRLNALMRINCY